MVPTRNGRSGLDTWGSFPFLSIFGTTRHPNSCLCRKTVAFCTCGWEEYAWPADCSLSHNSFACWFASFWSSLKMEDLKWWFDVVCYCLKKTSRHPNIAIFTGTVMINPCVLFFLGTTFPEPNRPSMVARTCFCLPNTPCPSWYPRDRPWFPGHFRKESGQTYSGYRIVVLHQGKPIHSSILWNGHIRPSSPVI